MSERNGGDLERADVARMSYWMSCVTLRLAGDADRAAIEALAQRAGASVPRAPVLIVEQDGVLRAARSLVDASTVSDPWAEDRHLQDLLAAHAGRRRRGTLARRLRRWEALWERHASAQRLGVSGQDALTALHKARRAA